MKTVIILALLMCASIGQAEETIAKDSDPCDVIGEENGVISHFCHGKPDLTDGKDKAGDLTGYRLEKVVTSVCKLNAWSVKTAESRAEIFLPGDMKCWKVTDKKTSIQKNGFLYK